MNRLTLLFALLLIPVFCSAQDDMIDEWRRLVQQIRSSDTIPADTLFAIAHRIRVRVKHDDSVSMAKTKATPDTLTLKLQARKVNKMELKKNDSATVATQPNASNISTSEVAKPSAELTKRAEASKPAGYESPLPFDDQFFKAFNLTPSTLDSIESKGISNSDADAKGRAMRQLEEPMPSNIAVAYGYVSKKRDFNFSMPIMVNDYRTIAQKLRANLNDDNATISMKMLYLADTFPDHILSRKELIECAKKMAALTTRLTQDDTLCYKRIRIPIDLIVQEILTDNKTPIETLPGGFKTSTTLKVQIDRRIAEVKGVSVIDSLNREEYSNLVKKFCYKADSTRDRVLTEEEIKNGLLNMKEIIESK